MAPPSLWPGFLSLSLWISGRCHRPVSGLCTYCGMCFPSEETETHRGQAPYLSSPGASSVLGLVPGDLGATHTVTLQSSLLCSGPSSHLWNGHRLRCAELWEGAVAVNRALSWCCRRRPQTTRRRSTGCPSCPSRPAPAPSSAGSARRTLHLLRGEQAGGGQQRPSLPRIPNARVNPGQSPLFTAFKWP